MKDIFEQFNFDTVVYRRYATGKQKIRDIFDTKIDNFYNSIDKLDEYKKEELSALNKLRRYVRFAWIFISVLLFWLFLSGIVEESIGRVYTAWSFLAFWIALISYDQWGGYVSNIVTFGKYKKLEQSISHIDDTILKAKNDIEELELERDEYLEKLKSNIKTEVASFEKEFCDCREEELEDFYDAKLFRKRSDSENFKESSETFSVMIDSLREVNDIFLTRKIKLSKYGAYISKRRPDLEFDKLFGKGSHENFVSKWGKTKESSEFINKTQSIKNHSPIEQKYKLPQKVDWQKVNIKNQKTGLKGEEIVMELEKEFLQSIGRDDLAQSVRHVSVVDGDGAGYDIKSFFENGDEKYIEVKSTVNSIGAQYFISSNELAFLRDNKESYFIYRVSLRDSEEVILQVISGEDFLAEYTLNPVQYSVKSKV